MPNVYNLAFGLLVKDLEIDDQCRLKHRDHSKVFSTIVFAGQTFLNEHKGKYLGIDGSTTTRAYMYYRCIKNNFEYLNSHFNIFGVNYYLRIFRDGFDGYDFKDLLVTPYPIKPDVRVRVQKLYNYFIFKLK